MLNLTAPEVSKLHYSHVMKIASTRFLNLNLALALNLFKGGRFIGNAPLKKITPQYYEA